MEMDEDEYDEFAEEEGQRQRYAQNRRQSVFPSSSSSHGSNNGNESNEEEDEELPSSSCYGVGRPFLGYRNVAAYVQGRGAGESAGPATRFSSYTKAGQADTKLLQTWQPHLMLDTETTMDLVKEH